MSKKSEVVIDMAGNMIEMRPDGSRRVRTLNDAPSLTIQEQRDSVDLERILARHANTGVMTNIREDSPLYGDFTQIEDYQSAQIALQNAKDSFTSLPNDVRKYFDHDPAKLLDFISDANNRDKAIELGLIEKEPSQPNKIMAKEVSPDESTPTE
jgi:phage internal scaffolding protein